MSQSVAEQTSTINVYGARTHNLKNISLQIPRNQLVVFTGRSGSGKSSLALGTIFAEGQRQYIESLSFHSRQFLAQVPRADVDLIEGLQPTLCLEQKRSSANRRSTVGTVTEIYDFLRLLFARVGHVQCHQCAAPISQQTPQQIRDTLMKLPAETKLMLLSPMVLGKKGAHAEVVAKIRKERLVRIRLDGEIYDIEQLPVVAPSKEHTLEAVTDRVIVRAGNETRILEAIELATELSGGLVTAVFRYPKDHPDSTTWHERVFNIRFACPHCDISYPEIETRTFSFNSPYGACQGCGGLGTLERFSPERIWPDENLSLSEQPLLPWSLLTKSQYAKKLKLLAPVLDQHSIGVDQPLSRYSQAQRDALFLSLDKDSPGINLLLEKELATTLDDERLDELLTFRREEVCADCHGSRLCPAASAVRLGGETMLQLLSRSLWQLHRFFQEIEFSAEEVAVADPVIVEIQKRLSFLNDVGAGYLSLGRAANTLSGGELQRVRLATSIGNQLTGVCYVLDEPTVGLHPVDTERLLNTICNLRDAGNSILVVEHDELFMKAAEHLIDIGPGAGKDGGEIVASGRPNDVASNPNSLTGNYLAGDREIKVPDRRREPGKKGWLQLKGVSGFNLAGVDASIPLGNLVVVTGVSGSGKSSLIEKTLYPLIAESLGLLAPEPLSYQSFEGSELVDSLVRVSQQPIGRTARACPATFTGIMNHLRKLFAATKLSKQRGYTTTRFSFNDKSGACPECKGLGRKIIRLNFLPEIEVVCEKCNGQRFERQTLQVKFRGKSIADFLNLSVAEALHEFENVERIHRVLECLSQVGLDYLPLGQPATTLSGGEAQRIKLATELSKRMEGHTLYLLDEPTTGLHMEDVAGLLRVLHGLVDLGHSVLVVEHNLDLIKTADWVIDLGPGGGEQGGSIVATGTPEQVASNPASLTGQFLKPGLGLV